MMPFIIEAEPVAIAVGLVFAGLMYAGMAYFANLKTWARSEDAPGQAAVPLMVLLILAVIMSASLTSGG